MRERGPTRQKTTPLSNIMNNVCGSNISHVDDYVLDFDFKFNCSLDSRLHIEMICCRT